MKSIVSIAFLVVGVVLLVAALGASESLGSSVSRLFSGTPTDKTLWLMAGGAVATAVGLAGLLRGSRP